MQGKIEGTWSHGWRLLRFIIAACPDGVGVLHRTALEVVCWHSSGHAAPCGLLAIRCQGLQIGMVTWAAKLGNHGAGP